jgi:hypothetical protein
MAKVKEIRESIDERLDRWEASALALEANIDATPAEIAARIERQKEKAAKASEKLKQSVERAKQLPAEAREKIAGDIDHLKVQLALGKAEARDAVFVQKGKIDQAVRNVEKQIDQFEEQVDQVIQGDIEAWVLADMELREELDLAASRFEHEKAEKRERFEAKKQEMRDKVTQFRNEMEEKRAAAQEKGSKFSSEIKASLEQMKTAFHNLTE